jgi:hypothetical protein
LELLVDVGDCPAKGFERVANVYNSSGHVKSVLRVSNKISVFVSNPASRHEISSVDSKSI